jgi:predicted dehydrogenase
MIAAMAGTSELPGTATFATLEELAGVGAQAVAISTSASTHTAVTEQALRLGLAVVCDKPFAMDAQAALGTIQLAARLGLPVSPYQNRRWDSGFRTVSRLAADGSLGTVTLCVPRSSSMALTSRVALLAVRP